MTAKTICFASSKGGSGKTTITATVGAFLQETGKSVLIVDCDEGTHGLTLMYLNEVNERRKSYDGEYKPVGVFDASKEISEDQANTSLVTVGNGVCLLPARYSFSDAEESSIGESFGLRICEFLDHVADRFDYILLDAQAGISEASKIVMSPKVSDTVVLVSEYDPMSNAGIERLKARLPEELDASRTWILLNKLLPEFVSKFSEFLSVARYLPPVPWTADVVRAYSRRRLALDFGSGNQFTLAVLNIVRELVPDRERHELEHWVEAQTERLREPIAEQLDDAERLLAVLKEQAAQPPRVIELNRILLRAFSRSLPIALAVLGMMMGISGMLNSSNSFSIVLERLLPGVGSTEVLLVLSVGILISVMFERTTRAAAEYYTDHHDQRAEGRAEISETLKRIKELKELSSANYEEMVHSKNEQG